MIKTDKILIRRYEYENKTFRGLNSRFGGGGEKNQKGTLIPDTAKEKPQEGKVIAVGPGKVNEKGERIPLDVKKGDRVLFGKYVGSEIKIGDVEPFDYARR